MLNVSVVVYLDDILIYSDDQESHRANIWEVLRQLRKHGLFCNPFKCEFHTDTIEYLGYILSLSGLQTKSTLSLNGLHLAKSKTFNLSSVSATIYIQLFRNYYSTYTTHSKKRSVAVDITMPTRF